MAGLAKQLEELASRGAADLEGAERLALLKATYKLSDALENPMEKILRMFFAIYDPIVIRLAVDLNLFDIVLAHDGPISLSELAEKSKADAVLLQRIFRMLVALNVFAEPSDGMYTATPLSPVFSSASPVSSAVVHFVHLYQSVAAMPDFFRANGYKNPTDARNAPCGLAWNCKGQSYFEFMSNPGNERLAKAFNATMELQKSKDEESFIEAYPAMERLKQDDPDRVLFVDVGGGLGHQVRKFGERYPSLPGKLVLEDLPEVIDQAVNVPETITKIAYDFFTPQPELVKNAKAFYLRMILHDWPEKQALAILSNIANAMADDSVVLIHEVIIPESGAAHFEAKMDWHMMNLSAMERTERQWAELAASVGLKINGVWWEEEGAGRRGLLEMGKLRRLF